MAFDLDDEELEWTLRKLNKSETYWVKTKQESEKEKRQKEDNNETEAKNK